MPPPSDGTGSTTRTTPGSTILGETGDIATAFNRFRYVALEEMERRRPDVATTRRQLSKRRENTESWNRSIENNK